MSYSEMERRRAVRHKWLVDIFYDGAEGVGVAQTQNISLCGLYFNTVTSIPKGSHLQLRLPIDPEKQQYLVVDAEVAYSQPGVGVAVEFLNLTEPDRLILESFITENRQAYAAAGGMLGEE